VNTKCFDEKSKSCPKNHSPIVIFILLLFPVDTFLYHPDPF